MTDYFLKNRNIYENFIIFLVSLKLQLISALLLLPSNHLIDCFLLGLELVFHYAWNYRVNTCFSQNAFSNV